MGKLTKRVITCFGLALASTGSYGSPIDRITDQANLGIEIRLQSPDGSSFFEIIDNNGIIELKKVE